MNLYFACFMLLVALQGGCSQNVQESTVVESLYKKCQNNPCSHGGSCYEGTNSYTCACAVGFTDRNCKSKVAECSGKSCRNATPKDLCMSGPCRNGGACYHGDNHYSCTCLDGFYGANCMHQDSCKSSPCINGECTNEGDSFYCTCDKGYAGQNCDSSIDRKKKLTKAKKATPCTKNSCLNGGKCKGSTCKCATGYYGPFCEIDIDECATDPCKNGASCYNEIGLYTCTCAEGFMGYDCEIKCPNGSTKPNCK